MVFLNQSNTVHADVKTRALGPGESVRQMVELDCPACLDRSSVQVVVRADVLDQIRELDELNIFKGHELPDLICTEGTDQVFDSLCAAVIIDVNPCRFFVVISNIGHAKAVGPWTIRVVAGGVGFVDVVMDLDIDFGGGVGQPVSFPAGVSCASVFGPDVNPHLILDVDKELFESNEGNNFGLLALTAE